MNAVLEESIAGYYGAILEAGIKPQICICEQAVKRKLNRQALARIFSNIIANALKYSDGDLQVRGKSSRYNRSGRYFSWSLCLWLIPEAAAA